MLGQTVRRWLIGFSADFSAGSSLPSPLTWQILSNVRHNRISLCFTVYITLQFHYVSQSTLPFNFTMFHSLHYPSISLCFTVYITLQFHYVSQSTLRFNSSPTVIIFVTLLPWVGEAKHPDFRAIIPKISNPLVILTQLYSRRNYTTDFIWSCTQL